MSGTIVPLIWQTYKKGVEKKDVWMKIGLAQNFVTYRVLIFVSIHSL